MISLNVQGRKFLKHFGLNFTVSSSKLYFNWIKREQNNPKIHILHIEQEASEWISIYHLSYFTKRTKGRNKNKKYLQNFHQNLSTYNPHTHPLALIKVKQSQDRFCTCLLVVLVFIFVPNIEHLQGMCIEDRGNVRKTKLAIHVLCFLTSGKYTHTHCSVLVKLITWRQHRGSQFWRISGSLAEIWGVMLYA